jgi:hypothetical protein
MTRRRIRNMTLLLFRTAVTLAVALLAVPALAQDELPSNAMLHKVPVSIFSLNPEPMSGQVCNSGATSSAARADINPITGEKQSAPIVAIPLTAASGNIARATEREQAASDCEAERDRGL